MPTSALPRACLYAQQPTWLVLLAAWVVSDIISIVALGSTLPSLPSLPSPLPLLFLLFLLFLLLFCLLFCLLFHLPSSNSSTARRRESSEPLADRPSSASSCKRRARSRRRPARTEPGQTAQTGRTGWFTWQAFLYNFFTWQVGVMAALPQAGCRARHLLQAGCVSLGAAASFSPSRKPLVRNALLKRSRCACYCVHESAAFSRGTLESPRAEATACIRKAPSVSCRIRHRRCGGAGAIERQPRPSQTGAGQGCTLRRTRAPGGRPTDKPLFVYVGCLLFV